MYQQVKCPPGAGKNTPDSSGTTISKAKYSRDRKKIFGLPVDVVAGEVLGL
jgi:hypothetical protein